MEYLFEIHAGEGGADSQMLVNDLSNVYRKYL
jgi:protein subunit release factor A